MTKTEILVLAAFLLALNAGAQTRSISLKECLDLSHSNNAEVVNAAIDSRIAQAQRQEVLSLWFPTVSASAYGFQAIDPLVKVRLEDVVGNNDAANNLKYFINSAAGLNGLSTEWSFLGHGYIGGLNITQPLFAGGRIANGNALAVLGVKAADIKSDMALRDNEGQVVGKYWAVVSLSEKKKALQQGLDLIHSLEKDVAAACEAGLARESDLLQVRLKAKELESQMIKLKSGERLAKMDLFNFVGMDYKVLDLDDMTLSDTFDELLSPDNYHQDEHSKAASLDESRLLEMSVEAKKLEKKMAIGEGLPQIGIGATAGYVRMIGDPRPNGIVYAMVKIPISDWGKTSRKIKRCQYEIDKAENDKEYLDKQLLLKVSKEWMDLQSAWDQKEAAEDAVAISEMIETQKHKEYEAGLCTLSELLQCQTELQSVRSAYFDSLVEYCNALETWKK